MEVEKEETALRIVSLTAAQAGKRLEALVDLLLDAVDSGASIGFLPPLGPVEARDYWQGVIEAVRGRQRVLLAVLKGKLLQGSVQLGLEMRANGNHRAEAMKLFVHRRARRRGLARALIDDGAGERCQPAGPHAAGDGHPKGWRSREAVRIAGVLPLRRSAQLRSQRRWQAARHVVLLPATGLIAPGVRYNKTSARVVEWQTQRT